MIKNYLVTLLLLVFTTSFSQINLVGIRYNDQNNSFSLVKWNTATPAVEQEFPSSIPSYLLGSSLFDANNSIYYFRSEFQLNSFNTQNNELLITQEETLFNSATEIDMSNGNIYTILPEAQIPSTQNPESTYFSFVKLNANNNSVTEIGTIQENVTAIALSEGTCLNSDTSDFYFTGFDSSLRLCIYKSNLESDTFSYTKITLPVEDVQYYLSGLYFDIQSNAIIAIKSTFDEGTESTNRQIIKINPNTGTITNLYTFNTLMTIQNGSTTFDQATRSYILVTIDALFNRKLFVYNTITNTATETTFPANVGEIEADNTNFSILRYATLNIDDFNKNNIVVYPNPVKNNLTIDTHLIDKSIVSIYSIDGRLCYTNHYSQSSINIDLSMLKTGIYTLKIENKLGITTEKIVKE